MKKFIKEIYHRIPLKKEFFDLVKKMGIPPQRIRQHLNFRGSFWVPVGDGHGFKMMNYGYLVENQIYWMGLLGGWEKVSMGLWVDLCKKAGSQAVVLDIGANTGVYSLIAKSLLPDAQVYAFEPVVRVMEKLKENNTLNGFDIFCVEKAVSDSDGTAVIYDLPSEHVYSVTVNQNLNQPGTTVIPTEIKTLRLATFIEQEQLERIDLMKIDVETHEPEVLIGMEYYLRKFRPTMLIEILNDGIGERVEELLSGMGYLYFNIDEASGIRRVTHIRKSDHFNFLVCQEEVARSLNLL